jgi:hypothetical protein
MATMSISFLTAGQRFLMAITACRSHNWSFPQTDRKMDDVYAANSPYDSHQQCPTCGAMRLYNSQTMEGGPFFQKSVAQNG